ncbi:hypothetical protein FLAVO9R_30008 [Flavobacterium sp. 9R]|nr:hypothetical protein FLAVO9R_30008 [Flavobacterium sp. 9R]
MPFDVFFCCKKLDYLLHINTLPLTIDSEAANLYRILYFLPQILQMII